jgi:hypothetical protein
MRTAAGLIERQAPGGEPEGAVEFVHGLMAKDAAHLSDWVRSQPDALWGTWLEAQGLAPLTLYVLRTVGLAEAAKTISDALRRSYYTATANHALLSETLRELTADLRPLAIQPIVLKGMALCSTLYPVPATRPCSDLDLLVGRSQITAVEKALMRQGFHDAVGLGTDERLAYTSHLMLQRSLGDGQALNVEVHWHLLNDPGYVGNVDIDEMRARAQSAELDGSLALVLEPVDQMLHACAHLLLHHAQRPRLIWLLDLRMLVLRYSQSWNWTDVVSRAQGMHLAAALRYWLMQAEYWFGVFLPENARAALDRARPAADEARYIAAAQSGDEKLWKHYWRRMTGAAGLCPKLTYLREILFPPWAFMQRRYGAGSRWLAPLYYGWRLIRAGLTAFQRSA